MDKGLDRKINSGDSAGIQDGLVRVQKPSELDVLCGRGAPIQSHHGNVRMRELVSKYARRYFESRKYRKQLVAEEALMEVKNSGGKTPVRFLRKADRQDYWVEVDDKIAGDKVQHTLRSFVRKLEVEGTSEASGSHSESSSLNDSTERRRRTSIDSLSQSQRSLPATQEAALDRSAMGVDVLRRSNSLNACSGNPMLAVAGHPSVASLHHSPLFPRPVASVLAPGLPHHYHGLATTSATPLTSQSAAEAELQYRLSLRRMPTEELMRLVAAERAQRHTLSLENPAIATSIAPVPQYGQQDYQRMPPTVNDPRILVAPRQGTVAQEEKAGERKVSTGLDKVGQTKTVEGEKKD